jgi:hypothetical protein
MIGSVQRVTLVLAIVALAGCGGADQPASVVHPDGRIGPFRIDATTEAQLRARLGAAEGLITRMDPSMTAPHGGRTLVYVCGNDCRTEYSFNNDTHTLSDFWTQSPRWSTEHGSRPGMRFAKALARERMRRHPGCSGDQVNIRVDAHHTFVVIGWKKTVNNISYLGPRSTYYDGLC